MDIKKLTERIIDGGSITREEALELVEAPLDEVRRIIAIFKYILPKASIRFAAGRDCLDDTGIACFKGGSNATITGNMLTVKGISIDQDIQTIADLGYCL